MKVRTIVTSVVEGIKSVGTRGRHFRSHHSTFPKNEEDKYSIQAEGIRLDFTNHDSALDLGLMIRT